SRAGASRSRRPVARTARRRSPEGDPRTVCTPRPTRGSTFHTQDKTCIPDFTSAPELHAHEIERRPRPADIKGKTGIPASLVVDRGDEIIPQLLVDEERGTEDDTG